MSRLVKFVIAANLVALAVLVFGYPNLMVGPGKLIAAHKALETDCFACHQPFSGSSSERCIACHKPADIGRIATTGKPLVKPLVATAFHQELASLECVSCHSEHAGSKRFRPQGRFNHSLLKAETNAQCQTCHRAPTDALHEKISGTCVQCHTQERWVPATFDHAKQFVLDRDHNARCDTCHSRNDYSRYTCYGCHEHTPDNVRREHVKEGIRDFANCVACHRSGNKHDIRAATGARGAERGKRERDEDD
jgi:hypothetical protein